MKIQHLLLVILALSFQTCKQQDWMDWKVQNELWLSQNASKEGVKTTSSGLQYKIIADPNPTDARPSASSAVLCDYTLEFINGLVVNSGKSVSLTLSSTVAGFKEGLQKIHCHGDIELYVPYELGYDDEEQGTEGTQAYIPPYSTLIFKVHLIDLTN